jgi:tRNA G10  N-methylase Trm11
MPILTSITGTNADLVPQILALYTKEGSILCDVTYGKGAFWTKVDTAKYDFRPTDLLTGVDFRNLPYVDGSIDTLVIDPPYVHTGRTFHAGLNRRYNNASTPGDHASIIRLYAGGILEASRVLKKKTGIIMVKTQDETESGKQRWSHMEITTLLELFGFASIDLFVLQRTQTPIVREKYQKSARKNHSYMIIGRFKK